MEFEYDDSGQTFTYFILAALAIYLVPATLSRIRRTAKGTEEEKSHVPDGECNCTPCQEKRKRQEKEKPRFNFSLGDVFYVFGLVVFVFLAYQATTYQQEKLYDPFEVLGLDHSASEKEIKAEYRRLSKQWHPDKNQGNPEAHEMFMRIAKAYEALTNEQIRKNWEEFGNPDGPGLKRFGIALPSFLVSKSNASLVLGLYALVFGLALPITVAVWWQRSRKYIKDSIMEKTVGIYVSVVQTASMPIKSLFKTMSLAEEFEVEMKVKDYDQRLLPLILKELDDLPSDPTKMGFGQINLRRSAVKALVLYTAHMQRVAVPPELEKDLEYCLKKSPILVQGLVEASAYRRFLSNALKAMSMGQMITQAFDEKNLHFPLLQIPHITNDHLRYLVSKKNNIKTVREFYKADLDTLKKDVLRMEDAPFEDVRRYGSIFPFLRVSYSLRIQDDAEKSTDGDEKNNGESVKISAGDVVLCTITLTRLTLEELRSEDADEDSSKKAPASSSAASASSSSKKDEDKAKGKSEKKAKGDADVGKSEVEEENEMEEEKDDEKAFESEEDEEWEELQKDIKKPKLSDVKKAESVPVHCPFYPFPKQEQWWVFLGDRSNGKDVLLTVPNKVVSLKREESIELRFAAPPPGKYSWTIYTISDSYIGADITTNLKFNVGKAADLPRHVAEEPEEEPLPELEDEEEGGESGEESDFA